MRVLPATALEPAALRELFNEGFSDYVVPMAMDEATFAAHLHNNDVDLACSRVVLDERPVAFALIARRGDAAWVGGMGAVPSRRRRGLGERALTAGLEAAGEQGCRVAWLEVIDRNLPAVRLYEKLGFETVRDVVVWSLPARDGDVPPSRAVDAAAARAWIAARRLGAEPWQRAGESLDAMARGGAALEGLLVDGAAVVFRDRGEAVTALQIAAVDAGAAANALLAAAGGRPLRLANAPADEPASRALQELGAEALVRQHEMRLAIPS